MSVISMEYKDLDCCKSVTQEGKILIDTVTVLHTFHLHAILHLFPFLSAFFLFFPHFFILTVRIHYCLCKHQKSYFTCIHASKGSNLQSYEMYKFILFQLSVAIWYNSVPVSFQRLKQKKNKFFIPSKFSFVTFQRKHSLICLIFMLNSATQ